MLADALSRGIDPNSTYYNSHTLAPGWLPGYPTYEVKTFEGSSAGSINLVQATLKSDNTVYAQLAADLGESTVTEMAHKMGVVSPLHSYAAEALGGLNLGVTPLEMADVYATLADGGWRNSPIAITKVVFPDGHVDNNWGKPHRVKVLSEAVTAEETSILHENAIGGTAGKSAINCPTAAKTGTTSELVDAWLDGYTPNYSTVVWMGYPNKRVSMTDVHGEPQQGGYLPAEIWHAYMAGVIEGKPCVPFPPSQGNDLLPTVLWQIRTIRAVTRSRRSRNRQTDQQATGFTHGHDGADSPRKRKPAAVQARLRRPRGRADSRSGEHAKPQRPGDRLPAGRRAKGPGGAPGGSWLTSTPFAGRALVVWVSIRTDKGRLTV